MPGLTKIDDVPAFREVRRIAPSDISDELRVAVANLHEVDDVEEFLRAILNDHAATPHGPAEIVDILTHRIELEDKTGLAAFVLKGRSFPTVRPKHASHQIYRLEKIDDLAFAALGATGVVLDAVKEQFTSTCKRLGVAYSILDTDDFARLFWAYGFLCPRDGTRIKGGRCHCGYAPSHSVLNVLQEAALEELARAHSLGQMRGLVVLPPGSGKTRIAAKDAHAVGAKSLLYVAHTHEILDVAKAELAAVFGSERITQLGSDDFDPTKPILLATIQHLTRNPLSISGSIFDYVVVDEFHHAGARTYRTLIGSLDCAFLLGLTATPFRSDRQDIAALCDNNVIVAYELRSGIEAGVLTPYHYSGCFDEVDYNNIIPTTGKYTIKDLERKLIIPERHKAVVKKWRERADGRPTLAFCCSHSHALRVAEEFSSAGVPTEAYLSTTSMADRKAATERLRRGSTKILCVVDVLNEGADLPFVECLLFLRPTESKRIFLQQLGRGLRKYVGKPHCVVIDFIGNFRNAYRIVEYHGLHADEFDQGPIGPTADRTAREILDLPIGCSVTFEDRVLDIFATQALEPRNATRENIGRILIHRYRKLSNSLGHAASPKEIDRYELLNSTFYKRVFGTWDKFVSAIRPQS